jgi:hypothetical protein
MSQPRHQPSPSVEQRAGIEATRARARKERPSPDELIDRAELDELAPQARSIETRALGGRSRRIRDGMHDGDPA